MERIEEVTKTTMLKGEDALKIFFIDKPKLKLRAFRVEIDSIT